MGKRTWIDSDIWTDCEGLNTEGLLLYLRLLTNDQRNIAGYYRLNLKHLALDMGITEAKLEKMLQKPQKYWAYDPNTKQVLIPKFTRYNIVRSGQQIKALNAELAKLKPSPLHKIFLAAFEEINGVGSLELIDAKFKREAEDILL